MTDPADDGIRAFIGVELPAPVRDALGARVERLRSLPVRVSWTPPERMHLTLVFLGDVPASRIERVEQILDGVCGGCDGFEMRVRGLGAFGSARRPSVIWAGMPDPPAGLMALQGELTRCLREAGFKVSGKAFHPHVTLGRVRGSAGVGRLTSAIASDNNTEFGIVPVRRVDLIRSHLDSGGVRYQLLRQSRLKGT